MRKAPLLLVVGLAFLFVFGVFNYFQQRQVAKDEFALHILERERHILSYLNVSRSLAKAGLWEDLHARLEEARKARYIDYFIVQYRGEPLFWGTEDGAPDSVDIEFRLLNEPVITDKVSYMSIPLDEDHLLTVGIYKRLDLYLARYMTSLSGFLAEEVLLFSLIGVMILLYHIRDIFSVLALFRNGMGWRKRDYLGIRTRSRESEMIVHGLSSYENKVSNLQGQNHILGNQVLPALKKEILSGRKPPYGFTCTLVRTDINNFSDIFNRHDVDRFMSTINEFFHEVSHVVSRYNGLVYEFIGDEVIYYFKDQDNPNSFPLALSAIRDINTAAGRLHATTMRTQGYPFTIKSSLAHGSVRFGELVNGYSLAGSILIETVRVLSHVVEKDGNITVFERSYLKHIEADAGLGGGFLCEASALGSVFLKGFSGPKYLFAYHKHRDLAEILNHLDMARVGWLTYYRSDEDITFILRSLRQRQATLSREVLFAALAVLRSYRLTKTNARPAMELIAWTDELVHTQENVLSSRRRNHLLASLALLPTALVPKPEFSLDLERRLSSLLTYDDKRVVANAIEALTYFGVEPGFGEFAGRSTVDKFARDLGSENSRILANLLVQDARKGISPRTVRILRRMLRSSRERHIASALYAVGEIASYHRERDAIYYDTHLSFHEVLSDVPEFVLHENAMVRRQAVTVLKKADDKRLRARALALSGNQSWLMREFGLEDPSGDSRKRAS